MARCCRARSGCTSGSDASLSTTSCRRSLMTTAVPAPMACASQRRPKIRAHATRWQLDRFPPLPFAFDVDVLNLAVSVNHLLDRRHRRHGERREETSSRTCNVWLDRMQAFLGRLLPSSLRRPLSQLRSGRGTWLPSYAAARNIWQAHGHARSVRTGRAVDRAGQPLPGTRMAEGGRIACDRSARPPRALRREIDDRS